jgi:hypothetical protein
VSYKIKSTWLISAYFIWSCMDLNYYCFPIFFGMSSLQKCFLFLKVCTWNSQNSIVAL